MSSIESTVEGSLDGSSLAIGIVSADGYVISYKEALEMATEALKSYYGIDSGSIN